MAACDTIPTSEFEADPIKQGMQSPSWISSLEQPVMQALA